MSEHPIPNSSVPAPPKRSNRNVAALLIGAGIFILLYNSGILHSVIWNVVWPLGLIAVGLDLVTEGLQRRRIVIGTLAAALVCAPLIGGSQLMSRPREVVSPPVVHSPPVGERVSEVRGDISVTAGSLSINSFDGDKRPSGDVRDVVQLDSGEDLSEYYQHDGATGVLNIDGGPLSAHDLDLRFAHNIPLNLTVNVGAGDASPLDFEDLRLESLDLKVGAGSTDIKLPERGVMNVTVSGGLGDIEIDVPDELAARIEVNASLGDVQVDDRFQLNNGVYLSDDYSDLAANRVTIDVKAGAGSIRIK